MSCLLEFGGAGGGGTPAGPSGAVQFNNSGSFGGDSGFTYAGLGQATHALGTITVNAKAINITGTWNAAAIATTGASGTGTTATITFAAQPTAYPIGSIVIVSGVTPAGYNTPPLGSIVTASTTTSVSYANTTTGAQTVAGTVQQLFDAPLFVNITNTASALGSYLADMQVGGNTAFSIQLATPIFPGNANQGNATSPALVITNYSGGVTPERGGLDWTSNSNSLTLATQSNTGAVRNIFFQIGNVRIFGTNQTGALISTLGIGASYGIGFSATANDPTASQDTTLVRQAAGILGVFNNASLGSACGLRIYDSIDTTPTPVNFDRVGLDFVSSHTAGECFIGTQKGGTGTARNLFIGAAGQVITFGDGSGSNENCSYRADLNGLLSNIGYALTGGTPRTGTVAASVNLINSASPATLGFGTVLNFLGAAASNAYFCWGGEARLDADFSATSNTTLANVTGTSHNLSVSLGAGRNYMFHICLLMVTGASAGGIKIGVAGTATVTNLIIDGHCLDGTTNIAVTRGSASPSTLVANTNAGTAPVAHFFGTFECNAAGTFTVQFAQNASNATASTVKRGSYMEVYDAL